MCQPKNFTIAIHPISNYPGVMPDLNRRRLIQSAAAAAGFATVPKLTASAAEPPNDFAVDDQQPFRGQTRRLKITNRGRYVASLIFSADYPTHFRLKPEFHPFLTPAGYPVTDSHAYCFIHHQAIMCGHGRVRTEDGRVIDFYRKLNFPDPDRADPWHTPERNLYRLGPSGIQEIAKAEWMANERVTIDLELVWRTREPNSAEGEAIIREKRRYRLTQKESHTILDHFTELIPVRGTAVLEADRHSFCGVRVNDLIDVEDGGTMRDSEGRVNPDGNYWDADGDRKAPRWIDCTGCIGDATAGITLMGHPENARNQCYLRDWGLMEVSPVLGEDAEFSADNPFRFAARYAAHDGEIEEGAADALVEEFGRVGIAEVFGEGDR